MIKFYTDKSHYSSPFRSDLTHFFRPFIKDKPVSREALVASYGNWINHFEMVSSVEECDVAVLPMAIEYYLLHDKRDVMLAFIASAKKAGKKIITETHGDFGVTPLVKDVIILRQNGYQSRRLKDQHAMPVIISDPMITYFHKKHIVVHEKRMKPVIGFCGQAETSFVKNLYDVCRTVFRNMKYYTGLSVWEPHNLYPSTLLRSRVLRRIEKDKRLIANFIKRKKYRAGSNSQAEREKTTYEFYQNMLDSDYIVCVRGGGNFSVRLYETLAMGRIPIFINSDSILPFDQLIDWKHYCVWVESNNLEHLGDIVADFHHSLTNEEFQNRQRECRELWEKYLTNNGVMMNLMSLINKA